MCEKEKCSRAADAATTNCCETCGETRAKASCAANDLAKMRQALDELDALFIKKLVDIIKSGNATPGHLNVMRQVLKDRGYSLPELLKKARMDNDAGTFDEDFDESELIH